MLLELEVGEDEGEGGGNIHVRLWRRGLRGEFCSVCSRRFYRS